MKTTCMLLIATIAVLLCLTANPNADIAGGSRQCDGSLLPQVTTATSNRDVRVAVMSLITRENYEQVKREVGANISIFGVDLGGSYDDFESRRSRDTEYVNFRRSEIDSRAVVRQSLTEAQLRAWTRCMTSQAVGIKLLVKNDDQNGANVELHYTGTPDTRLRFKVDVDGGKISNRTSATYTIPASGKSAFRVRRDAQNKSIYLIANGGGMADEAVSLVSAPPTTPPAGPPPCVNDNVLSRNAPAAASSNTGSAGAITDGNSNPGNWNALAFAPQWVQVDLRAARRIRHIKLIPEQTPSGATQHIITGARSDGVFSVVLGELRTNTISGGEYFVPISPAVGDGIVKVKVETIASPSWVSWREVEIHGCE